MGTVLITGAGGFLGHALSREFAQAGYSVRAGVRDVRKFDPPASNIEPVTLDLPHLIELDAFRDVDICIHAAYSMRWKTRQEAIETNLEGTEALLKACDETGVKRTVFVSSCSAHENTLSFYGKSKLELETLFMERNSLIVRPGLIVGRGGLCERLAASIRKLPLIPIFDGGTQILQTISRGECTRAILQLVEMQETNTHVLAERGGIEMKLFLAELARAAGKKPVFASLPSGLSLVGTRLLETLSVPLPVSSENLQGLRSMIHQDSTSTEGVLGWRFQGARDSLQQAFS